MHPSSLTRAGLATLAERVSHDTSGTSQTMYVEIPVGMSNQVDRFGILPKKTLHGDGQYIKGFRIEDDEHENETDESSEESHAADEEEVELERFEDLHIDACQTLVHPAYGQTQQSLSQSGLFQRNQRFRISLEDLSESATTCGFCAILYHGIDSHKNRWLPEWATQRWLQEHYPVDDFDEALEQKDWFYDHWDEIEEDHLIDGTTVDLIVQFSKESQTVDVQMVMAEQAVPDALELLTLVVLEFYRLITRPSPWTSFGPRPHRITDIVNDGGIFDIIDWVNNCKDNHVACNFERTPGNPTRLIKISQSEDQPYYLQLHETDPSRSYRYIALSHCWAYSNPLKTTRENLKQHEESIPYDMVSPVFDNAFHMTWCCGVNYIWIDSLCIIQNDAAEWEKESSRMGAVYSNALVVFASHGYDFGLRREALKSLDDPWRKDDPPVFCRPLTDHKNFFLPPTRTDSWFTRGWCMQERLLARRILHFGGRNDEMWFECNSTIECECGRSDESRDNGHKLTLKELRASLLYDIGANESGELDRDELWKYYIRFCEAYSAGHLTFATDSMPAMSSLVSELAPHLGDYFAGLWRYNLLLSLQWEVSDSRESKRYPEYVAPSFSWTSQSGGVIWYTDPRTTPNDSTHSFAEVLDISCTLHGQDRFGRVSAGQLTLRGAVSRLAVKSTDMVEPDGKIELETRGVGECFVAVDSLQDVEELQAGDLLTCLDVMRDREPNDRGRFASGLVLLPSKLESGCYRRIGFATMLAEHFEKAEVKVISIV